MRLLGWTLLLHNFCCLYSLLLALLWLSGCFRSFITSFSCRGILPLCQLPSNTFSNLLALGCFAIGLCNFFDHYFVFSIDFLGICRFCLLIQSIVGSLGCLLLILLIRDKNISM